MLRWLPVLASLVLLVLAGVAEGVWTNRWGFSRTLQRASARLDDVSLAVGEWQGEPLEEGGAREAARTDVSGCLLRRYTHRRTGTAVTVLLVCGRPGPVAVHQPDVCYHGADYSPLDDPTAVPVEAGGEQARFWKTRVQRADSPQLETLRLYWAWTTGGAWEASAKPRVQYAWAPVLYKLYVVREMTGAKETEQQDPSAEFLKDFLPAVEHAVAPEN
jgi:hypothetical protein